MNRFSLWVFDYPLQARSMIL